MNKGLQIFLSIVLLVIVGGLVHFSLKTNNRANIEPVENLEVKKDIKQQEINMSTENQVVVLKTNQGDVKVELFIDKAPKTAANFIKLAGERFYDGVRFHRVIQGFMIQTGDPLSKDVANEAMWGTGDPGYKFEDEFGEGLSNVPGTLSMANSGPNTNGSQFFINTGSNTFLDGKHAVFGKVIEGMEVVTKIEGTPTEPGDKPVSDMIIEKVELL